MGREVGDRFQRERGRRCFEGNWAGGGFLNSDGRV
jgi:hypothetical protein